MRCTLDVGPNVPLQVRAAKGLACCCPPIVRHLFSRRRPVLSAIGEPNLAAQMGRRTRYLLPAARQSRRRGARLPRVRDASRAAHGLAIALS